MTIKEAINKGMLKLKNKNIEMPKQKARILMQFALKQDRQYVVVHDNKELEKQQEKKYFEAIENLGKGQPLQHITHMQEFMKMNFYVNENVLIPRPDTEILVEEVVKIAQKINAKKILDMCTGSGAIAVALAKYLDEVKITAVDISKNAIDVAKTNAKNNNVEEKIEFLQSDLFEKLENKKYDIIVSNPPYIRTEVIRTLNKDVQREPIIALDGGTDGLEFYKKIIKEAYNYLKYQGYICLEIGYDQKIDVIEIIENEEKYTNTYCKKDLYDNDRVVVTKLGD